MGESDEDKKVKPSADAADSDNAETTDDHQHPDQPETVAETTDADSVEQNAPQDDAPDETGSESKALESTESPEEVQPDQQSADVSDDNKVSRPTPPPPPPKPRRSWLGIFNLLLIIAIIAVMVLYWQQEQIAKQQLAERFSSIEQLVGTKLSRVDLSSLFEADEAASGERASLSSELAELGSNQQQLRQASDKLYELYGRDRNDWQLAEVEYLMRVAQHKLTLEHDFEGAALTLRVASDKIAEAADTGLLPVRVKISEEIAELKTRQRVDLVGIALTLTEMERQLTVLQPGFAVAVPDSAPAEVEVEEKPWLQSSPREVLERLDRFVDSLVRVRYENNAPTSVEANQLDVGDSLRDWLKLARWAVLDRNEKQYLELLERAEQLFVGFYSQDKDENRDFLAQLVSLKNLGLTADKPDISGSLFMLRKILQQRVELEANSEVAQ